MCDMNPLLPPRASTWGPSHPRLQRVCLNPKQSRDRQPPMDAMSTACGGCGRRAQGRPAGCSLNGAVGMLQ